MKGLPSYPNPELRKMHFPPGVPPANLFYRFCRQVLQVGLSAFWQTRIFNRHLEPTRGGAVYVCNHQSFLDPIVMSMALRRPMNYMARDSLFKNPVYGAIIRKVYAFPVRRGQADTAALKTAVARIREGHQVVVFAEGTRTPDGRIGPLLPGVALLAQRARAITVPVVIDGAFECWPRSKPFPMPGQITVQYGQPISPEQARDMKAGQYVQQLRRQLIDMQTDLRRRLGRPQLHYDQDDGPTQQQSPT